MNDLTQLLAIWGAVTGTIGTILGTITVILRIKEYKKTQDPRLSASLKLGFDSNGTPNHKIRVANIARPPVTLDRVRYYIRPRRALDRLLSCYHHRCGRWLHEREITHLKAIELTEGKSINIGIELPEGLRITDIYSGCIIDQTGRRYRIQWPRHRHLRLDATSEDLHRETIENDKRIVRLFGCRGGSRYYLNIHYQTKTERVSVPCGCTLVFQKQNEFQTKLRHIKEQQVRKFMNEEIQEIS